MPAGDEIPSFPGFPHFSKSKLSLQRFSRRGGRLLAIVRLGRQRRIHLFSAMLSLRNPSTFPPGTPLVCYLPRRPRSLTVRHFSTSNFHVKLRERNPGNRSCVVTLPAVSPLPGVSAKAARILPYLPCCGNRGPQSSSRSPSSDRSRR